MSFITFPLNNTDYTADDMALYFSGRTNGVFSKENELITLSNNTRMVTIKPGRAWINFDTFKGFIFANTTDINLDVAIADGVLNRIDRVVIKYDVVANESSIYIKKGTPNTSPIPPTLTRDTNIAYELGIADIYIGKGSTIVSSADIKDTRLDESLCGLVSDGITKITTEGLYNQFNDWFNNVKEELTTDAAGNLLNLINALQGKFDELKIQVEENSQIYYFPLTEIDNMNNITTAFKGFIYQPIGSPYNGDYGYFICFENHNGDSRQIIYGANNENIFTRFKLANNNYSSWAKFQMSYWDDISKTSLPKITAPIGHIKKYDEAHNWLETRCGICFVHLDLALETDALFDYGIMRDLPLPKSEIWFNLMAQGSIYGRGRVAHLSITTGGELRWDYSSGVGRYMGIVSYPLK